MAGIPQAQETQALVAPDRGIVMHARRGETRQQAVCRAIQLAERQDERVTLVFNGRAVPILPCHVSQILADWDKHGEHLGGL